MKAPSFPAAPDQLPWALLLPAKPQMLPPSLRSREASPLQHQMQSILQQSSQPQRLRQSSPRRSPACQHHCHRSRQIPAAPSPQRHMHRKDPQVPCSSLRGRHRCLHLNMALHSQLSRRLQQGRRQFSLQLLSMVLQQALPTGLRPPRLSLSCLMSYQQMTSLRRDLHGQQLPRSRLSLTPTAQWKRHRLEPHQP